MHLCSIIQIMRAHVHTSIVCVYGWKTAMHKEGSSVTTTYH